MSDSSVESRVGVRGPFATGISCLAFLLALYKTNPDWMFTGLGWLDAWYHVAYGLYFGNPQFLNDYYKVSRLPWNLYQYVVRHVLAPIPAEIFIQFSMYIAAAVLMYFIGSRLFGRVAGILVGLFTAALTIVHANGGADYSTQMAGPLFLAVIAAIIWSTRPNASEKRFLAVGALLSSLIFTYEAYIFLLPFIIGIALALTLINAAQPIRKVLLQVAWVVAGAILMTAAFCAINAAFGRGWLFFAPALNYDLALGSHRVPTPWHPWSAAWLLQATQVGFIFGVAAVAVADGLRLVVVRRSRRQNIALSVHALYLFEVLIWIALQSRGNSALTPAYVAYPLYGPMFISLAASLSSRFVDDRYTIPLAFTLVPVFFFLGLRFDSTTLWSIRQLSSSGFILALVGIIGYYAFLWLLPRWNLTTVVALAGLPLINGVTSVNPPDYAPATCHLQRELYTVMMRGSSFTAALTGNPQNVFVWGDSSEPIKLPPDCPTVGNMNMIAYPFASMGHSYLLSNPWPTMPKADQIPLDDLKEVGKHDDAVVVAITDDPNRPKLLAERFAKAGWPLYFVATLLPPRGNALPPFYVFRTRQCVAAVCLPSHPVAR